MAAPLLAAAFAGRAGAIGFTGRVTAEDGVTPIAGAAVLAINPATDAIVYNTTTAGDGTYALPAVAGTYHVQTAPSGYFPALRSSHTVTTGDITVNFAMQSVGNQAYRDDFSVTTGWSTMFGSPNVTTDGNIMRYWSSITGGAYHGILKNFGATYTTAAYPYMTLRNKVVLHSGLLQSSDLTYDYNDGWTRREIFAWDAVDMPWRDRTYAVQYSWDSVFLINDAKDSGPADVSHYLDYLIIHTADRGYAAGQVTGKYGGVLPGIRVQLRNGPAVVGEGLTDAAGNYTVWAATSAAGYNIYVSSGGAEFIQAGVGLAGRVQTTVNVQIDTAPPAAVTDLSALTTSTGSVKLTWTSVGDDGFNGTLNNSSFTIQYATHTGVTWSPAAAQVTVSTNGINPWFTLNHTVGGLQANTTYYFRLWTRDALGTYSALSNGATTVTMIESPTSVYVEEVGVTTITASAYAAAFTGLEFGFSGVGISTNAQFDAWSSTGNYWETKASLQTPRSNLAAAFTGGRLYAVGGFAGSPSALNEEYDPAGNFWQYKAPLLTARQSLSAVAIGGKVYAVGGTDGSTLGTNEEYDPAANSWVTRAPMPTARYNLGAAATGGKIYAVGGFGAGATDKNEVYDPAADAWTTLAGLPAARYGLAAAAVSGRIYAIGGYSAGYSNKTEEYDPASGLWTTKAVMLTPRSTLAVAALGGKIYALGGGNGVDLGNSEEYDPLANSWRGRLSMPTPRSNLAAAVIGGRVYAVGGWGGIELGQNEAFNPGVTLKIPGLKPNTLYSLQAKSRNQAGLVGAASLPAVSTYTLAYVGLPEFGSAVYGIGYSSAAVRWSSGTWATGYNGPGAGYLVHASTSPAFSQPLQTSKVYNTVSTTFTLAANTTYYFRVQAYNAGGMTDYSWLLLSSAATHIEPPAGIYFDEISTYSVTASVYAPSLTGLERGYSGVAITTGAVYEVWGSTGNYWRARQNAPLALNSQSAAGVNGKLYVFGGTPNGVTYSNSNNEYDPVANAWTTKANIPDGRSLMAAAVAGGRIYTIGGVNTFGVRPFNEVYDPASNTWRIMAPLPEARERHAAAAVNGKIYVIGGNNGGVKGNVYEYDPAFDVWTEKTALSVPKERMAAGTINGRIYIAGGFDGFSYLTDAEEYEPSSNLWTAKAPMPTPRAGAAAGVIGGKLYAVAGYDNTNLRVNEAYDPAADSWATMAPAPTAREGMAYGTVNGKLYLVTGNAGAYLTDNEEYNPGVSMHFKGLGPNRNYTFKAKTRNQVWIETGEIVFSTYTLALATVPAGGQAFQMVGASSVTVVWSSGSVTDGFNGPGASYLVQASTHPDFKAEIRYDNVWEQTQRTLEWLEAETTYYFRVQAHNNWGATDHSWTLLGSTLTPKAAPEGVTISTYTYYLPDRLGLQSPMALDSQGNLYFAYTKQHNGRSRVFVARSQDNGKTWADTTLNPVETAGDVPAPNSYDQFQPALAIDSKDGLHLVWGGANNALDPSGGVEPKCVYSSAPAPGVAWGPHVLIPGHSYQGNELNFHPVVDSQDGLHIVWNGYNCATPGCVRVRYSSRTADSAVWAAYQDINEDTFETGDFSVVMDRRDGLHLAAARATGLGTHVRPRMAYAFKASTGGWTAWDNFFADGNGFGQFQPTLAMDPDGKLGAAWFSADITFPNSQIKYSFKPYGEAWTPADIAQAIPEAPQAYPAIFADGAGKFYLLWSGSDTVKPMVKIKVSEYNGANWEPWDNAFSSDQIQLYPRVRWAGWRNNGGGLDIGWSDYDGLSSTTSVRHLKINDVPMFQGWTALEWPKPAGCGYAVNVFQAGGGDFGGIQAAVNSLIPRLSTTACVVIRDDQTYIEQVTVQGFESEGGRILIMKDPTFVSSGPVVNPPAWATAAFRIQSDSVTLQGLDIISTNTISYGVFASSSHLTLSGFRVLDSDLKIINFGVYASSKTQVYDSTIAVNGANALWLEGGWSLVSRSSITSGVSFGRALDFNGAHHSAVTDSYIENSQGTGLEMNLGASHNTVSQSTIASGGSGPSVAALYVGNSFGNSVLGSLIRNPAGHGAYFTYSSSNTIADSDIEGTWSSYNGLYFYNTSSSTVRDTIVHNPSGTAVRLQNSGANNIVRSTMTSNDAWRYALFIENSSTNTVADCYLQGSTAAYLTDSNVTMVRGSVLVSTWSGGFGLTISASQGGLFMTSSTVSGGPLGGAVSIGLNYSGKIELASNTIAGGGYGLNISPQSGVTLRVSSITFQSLAAGATAVNFLGGQFVMDIEKAAFSDADMGVNVNGGALSAGSLVLMPGASGPRYGARYENDPGSYVYWDLVDAQLVGPADGASGGTPAAALYVRAPGASTPVQYQYQVDTMPTMTAPPYSFDQTAMQSYSGQGAFSGQDGTTVFSGDSFLHTSTAAFVFYSTTTPLSANMTYYWRARARTAEAGDFGPWTAISQFSTGQPASPGPVNNLSVMNVTLSSPTMDGVSIRFVLRENNVSTGTTPNGAQYNTSDWVFVKFSTQAGADGTWRHATLTGGNITSGGVTVASDNRGVFFDHTVSTGYWVAGATVTWNYAIDGVTGANARVKVFAISMVKVPTGSFVYGAGNIGGTQDNNFGGGSQSNVTSANDVPAGAPAGWPNGYGSFYVMRYELTQGLYADFLNTLHSSTAAVLYASEATNGHEMPYNAGSAYGWRYGAVDRFAAKNYLSTSDLWSFLSWAALRPMTEMEFEKAGRDIFPDARKYPWGSAEPADDNTTGLYSPPNEGGTHKKYFMNFRDVAGGGKVLASGRYLSGDVYRTPEQTGASPYGIADLAGNVYEHVINCSYTALPDNGNGTEIPPATWPQANGTQKGVRGGNLLYGVDNARVSDRAHSGWSDSIRYHDIGGRGARKP